GVQIPTITIGCGLVHGVDAIPVQIEATTRHAGDGTPRLLGLVDACVREAYHRVLQAFFALELPQPRGVTTVNFAPAALRKHGSGFDLPLALALAGAAGLFPPERANGLFAFGEVGLRGQILPARGAVSVAIAAQRHGAHAMLCSPADATLCRVVDGLPLHGAPTLADAIFWLAGRRELPPPAPPPCEPAAAIADLADLRGHATPKLALTVAAAGGHNLLLVGPPGTGKSALLRRLPGLLPPLGPAERLAVLQVHAAAGLSLPGERRPLRAPHHTSSAPSLLGGGADVRPGEVTLAHHGVLFLDELPEFRRDVLEALRQPLEDGLVTVGRARQTVTMPAQFLLVAAMNPCPCGYRGHRQRPCVCTPAAVARYTGRLSGPLLDRLDLQVEVPALSPAELRGPEDPSLGTAALRERVLVAHRRQLLRQRGQPQPVPNARLSDRALLAACAADEQALAAVDDVLRRHQQSGRGRVRLLRLARTLADLDDRDTVLDVDVFQAASLRGFASTSGTHP
ncbi:MAG: YifB family Mg chelatase-like AAA ATPase, partial [Planctomycetes bacterium]|nr:YifB family Mg chelatase-like AAA ATPase [Planctomycetota bacterium]